MLDVLGLINLQYNTIFELDEKLSNGLSVVLVSNQHYMRNFRYLSF
jgi:hypothetical protein